MVMAAIVIREILHMSEESEKWELYIHLQVLFMQ